MKAIILSRYGSPRNCLSLEEVPKPAPREHEVLVRVRASTVNDVDWCFVRGKPQVYRLFFGLLRPKLAVLGAEVAGTVEAVGTQVKKFAPGDEVYGDLSEAGCGGFGEYVCVNETALVRKPPGITFEQAAAAPHAGMLAWQGLVEVGGIRHGETVLINGAGGGVGILGVQIAKRFGAEVTGVDGALKLPTLRSAGFDHVIDYAQEDFTRSGRRYHLILDTKTTRSPFRFLGSLHPGGRYVTVGGQVPRLLQAALAGPLIGQVTGKKVRVVALKPNRQLDQLNKLFELGALKSVIDGPYPLPDVPAAIQRFGDGKHIGKIVITVAETSASA
jgi:NADPH:quinone reductase-like Zn-dependent oxidoreductase